MGTQTRLELAHHDVQQLQHGSASFFFIATPHPIPKHHQTTHNHV